jgi:hypothetical protein
MPDTPIPEPPSVSPFLVGLVLFWDIQGAFPRTPGYTFKYENKGHLGRHLATRRRPGLGVARIA